MRIFIILFALVTLYSCKNNPVDDYKALSLLQYGMPVDVKAPEGAKVEAHDLGVMNDVVITSGDDYNVQIYASDANTIEVSKVLAEQKEQVKAGPFFSKILEEYEEGFIYEKKIDDTNLNYDFRYVKLMGDREYIYQTGLFGTFTEDQVRAMYESVQ